MYKTEKTPTPKLQALTSLLAETFYQLMQKEEEVEVLKARIAELEDICDVDQVPDPEPWYDDGYDDEICDKDFEDLNKKP